MSSTTATSVSSTETIRALNDRFRTRRRGGRLIMTCGIVGRPDVDEILHRVATFNDFSTDNDPYGEHDFGAFEQNGDTVFWKIDYYDCDLNCGSPDPADPDVTTRVLTVMLAEEY